DAMAGLWCVALGYGRREVAEAIAEQALRLPFGSTFFENTTLPSAALAAKLAELAPGNLGHVIFATGGSTANDTAIRLVHQYFKRLGQPDRKHVLALQDAYHGSTYLGASLTGLPLNRASYHVIEDFITHVPTPNPYRRPLAISLEQF